MWLLLNSALKCHDPTALGEALPVFSARHLVDGRTDLRLTPMGDGRILPRTRLFLADAFVDLRLRSSDVEEQ